MPHVSVIVPCYNHAPYLRQRMESIFAQTYTDYEVILLDDCSTDGSRSILEEYASYPKVCHVAFNEQNSGSAFRQWDKGIALAKGEWLWIAESDDWAEPEFLERMVGEAAKVPQSKLAYAATWWVDEHGAKLWDTPASGETIVYEGHDFIRRKLAVCNSIVNVSECIFRRDCYQPSESYRYEHMRLCGDWLFYVLLAEQGCVVEVREPLSYYRQHDSNISNDAERRGLTFLEGTDVLDYMVDYCGLKRRDYAWGWARMWSKYEKQYEFSVDVRRQVRRRLMQRHKTIVFYHSLYRMKSWLR